MKKCHACGQKLPLKVGDVVAGKATSGYKTQGIVIEVMGTTAKVQPFDGTNALHWAEHQLTRLHGYYRITEREPLG